MGLFLWVIISKFVHLSAILRVILSRVILAFLKEILITDIDNFWQGRKIFMLGRITKYKIKKYN